VKKYSWIIILVVVFLGISIAPKRGVAQKAPKFFISNLEGKRFYSKKQKIPYVISFFFVGCEPCIIEIPKLHKMMITEFPKIPLLLIDPLEEDTIGEIKEFASQLKVPIKYYYHDQLGSIGRKFFKGTMEFPTIIGIQKRKVLFRYKKFDEKSANEIRNMLQ